MNRFSSFLVYLKEKTLNVTNFKFQQKLLISLSEIKKIKNFDQS